MIYSRWRADRGGYDLFQDSHRVDLGNDMPVPTLTSSSPIGVASVSIGRKPRGALRAVGSSDTPVGTVLPTRKPLSAVGELVDLKSWTPYLPAFVVGSLAGWGITFWLSRRSK